MELAIIGFLFGCFVGFQSYKIYMDLLIRKILKQLKITSTDTSGIRLEIKSEPETLLFTESNNNAILLYKQENNQFMCQAPTLEELAKNLFTLNKINFATVNHNQETIWFVEGKVKKNLDN